MFLKRVSFFFFFLLALQCWSWFPRTARSPWFKASLVSTWRNTVLIKPVRPCWVLQLLFHLLYASATSFLLSFSVFERQWQPTVELLKRKITHLNEEEQNQDLSKSTTWQDSLICCCFYCSISLTLFLSSSKGNSETAGQVGSFEPVISWHKRDNWYQTSRWMTLRLLQNDKTLNKSYYYFKSMLFFFFLVLQVALQEERKRQQTLQKHLVDGDDAQAQASKCQPEKQSKISMCWHWKTNWW